MTTTITDAAGALAAAQQRIADSEIESQAAQAAERDRLAVIAQAAAEYRQAEPVAAQAFRDAVANLRSALGDVVAAGLAHGHIVAQVAAVANAYSPVAPGEPLKNGGKGAPSILGPGGYRALPIIDPWAWLNRIVAGAATDDLYPKDEA